jgi:NTE family protein
MSLRHQEDLLDRHLTELLGDIEPAARALLHRHLQWVTVAGGQVLLSQGEAGDSMYLVISGRLRAYQQLDDGSERAIREMGRGQVIGELSLFTDEPRSATIVAIRDSVLVRLGKAAFDELLASSARLSVLLTRQIIHRLQNPQTGGQARPVAVALLAVSAGIDLAGFGGRLAAQLARHGRVAVVDAAAVDEALQQPGLARSPPGEFAADHAIGLHLDAVEAAHDFVLLIGDEGVTGWTRRCARRSDELLLLADADQPPEVHAVERECLTHDLGRAEAVETLVLLHPAERRSPRHTRRWLDRRPVSHHLHLRPALDRDLARLARLLSGTAVGLVLAGGGARGFAHLGVYRALLERGVEIDCVGGTSMGAVMATLVASDRPLDELMAVVRRAFHVNPTGDFNVLPLVSLIAGRRLRRVIREAVVELTGFEAEAEDLWKPFYCVASNYTQAREQLVQRGPLVQALLASIAIPGALPPVLHQGDLLCDGGTFNNFPVDVMRGLRGVGQVVGVDLSFRRPRPLAFDEVPGTWALLRDRLRPRHLRRYRMPSLMAYLMNVTVLYSTSRQRQAQRLTDVYFNPPLDRVGMLQWKRLDDIVQQGLEHARQVLDQQPAGKPAAMPAAGDD